MDLPMLVARAQQAIEVISFAYQPPRLSDLFREAVAA
jgi:hypothetical protein